MNKSLITVTAAAAVLAVGTAGGAVAGSLINSADIKDDSIRSVDVKDETLKKEDIRPGVVEDFSEPGPAGPEGPEGPQGPQGPPGAEGTVSYSGEFWSVVHRNTIGNGDADLQAGPLDAPFGEGSLMIRTGGPEDKAAFGNETEFVGDSLSGLDTVSYSTYTTGENNARYAENNIGVAFEVDPSGADTAAPNYSTLVYVPEAKPANQWSRHDASTASRWFYTGAAATASGCTQADYCTLDEAQAAFANATLFSVQLTKGRDYAFSGAVDGLTLNDTTYDFEPFGVFASN